MKKISVLLGLLILCFGCMSSPSKNYYQIALQDSPPNPSPRIDKILYVDRITTQSFYDNFEIVYRESPFKLNYYLYHFWAEKPGPLFRHEIYTYLRKNRIFADILLDLVRGEPDLILRAKIRAIEEEDREETWYARLSMEFEILDFSTEETILFHEFDRLEKMPAKDIVYLPVIISQILQEELEAVLKALSEGLSPFPYP